MTFQRFSALIYHSKTQGVIRFLVHFLEKAPLHGLTQLARRDINLLEFIFWKCSIVLWVAVAIQCCVRVANDYSNWESTLIVKKDFLYFNTAMPAFTFCPHYIFDRRKAQYFLERKSIPAKEQFKILKFLEELSRRTIFSRKMFDEHDFPSWINATVYVELIFNFLIQHDIEDENGERGVPILTELGLCYTFCNVQADVIKIENWRDPKQSKVFQNVSIKTQSPVTISYRSTFPLKKTFTIKNDSDIFDFYIHTPYEIPTIWTRRTAVINASNAENWIIIFKAMEIIAAKTSSSDIQRRKCRKLHESNLKMFPNTYAQNLCLMECRARYAIDLCGCVPHFYALKTKNRQALSAPICTTFGLNCLSSYGPVLRKFSTNSESTFPCNCLPLCGALIVEFKVKELESNQQDNKIECYLQQTPVISLQRTPIFSEVDLAVSFGNFLSIFFGFSLLGGVEIIYFFTLRLFWYRRGYLGERQRINIF